MTLERTTVAFAFRSALSFAQIGLQLDALGKYTWTPGDSEWHGDYLGVSLTPEAVVRIYAMKYDQELRADLRFVAAAGDAGARARLLEAERLLLQEILPAIQAQDVLRVDPLE